MKAAKSPTYIDLFAGCGGLSLGLKSAGFRRLFALEQSVDAAATYYHNLVDPIQDQNAERWAAWYSSFDLRTQIDHGLVLSDVRDVIGNIRRNKNMKVDLVAGGPPCQGFSTAGRRMHDDERNNLPWIFLEAVKILQPKAVLIENVDGMARDFHSADRMTPYFQIAKLLSQQGYATRLLLLNALNHGVPQSRPRAFILAIKKSCLGNSTRQSWTDGLINLSANPLQLSGVLIPQPTTWRVNERVSVREALSGLPDNRRSGGARAIQFAQRLKKMSTHLVGARYVDQTIPKNHKLRNHSDKVSQRFKLLQLMNKLDIDHKLLYWEAIGAEERVAEYITEIPSSTKHRFIKECVVQVPITRTLISFNRDHDVRAIICYFKSKKHSQRVLDGSLPAPTIMTIPDDLVHPDQARVLTVREEARLQSFPDSFEFLGRETTGGPMRRFQVPQYSQVGNAVPPFLGAAIGKAIIEAFQSAKSS